MDALPIQETNNVPYKSKQDGVAHMCGHDCHMAALLTAAKVLITKKDQLKGTLKSIFQPAEEGGGGARVMVKEGILENPKVDEAYGLHVASGHDAGVIGIKTGTMLANADLFSLTITGKGGHGGIPDTTIDPIVIGSQLVVQFQSIVSRNISPFVPAVISICSFHAGTATNVIPEKAHLKGTLRTHDNEVHKRIVQRMKDIVDGTEKAFGVKIEFNVIQGYPATINSEVPTNKVIHSAKKVVGDDNVRFPM